LKKKISAAVLSFFSLRTSVAIEELDLQVLVLVGAVVPEVLELVAAACAEPRRADMHREMPVVPHP
jgi:hypothetical protein